MGKREENQLKLKREREGQVIYAKNGAVAELIEYNSWDDCTIRFGSGYEKRSEYGPFKKGSFKDPFLPSCYGVGYFGVGKWSSAKGQIGRKIHKVWNDIIKRCHSEKEQARYPTYKGCQVDSRWYCFQDFADWYVEQKGAFKPKWAMDKDLIGGGNKIYGPDTCFILPPEVNGVLLALNKQKRMNPKLPKGVIEETRAGGRIVYGSSMLRYRDGNQKRVFFGYFDDMMEAFSHYKQGRENDIRELANKYKGEIDDKAYDLLCNVEIKPFG